jgi:hypothetical protein
VRRPPCSSSSSNGACTAPCCSQLGECRSGCCCCRCGSHEGTCVAVSRAVWGPPAVELAVYVVEVCLLCMYAGSCERVVVYA